MKRIVLSLSALVVITGGTLALAAPAQALKWSEYCDGTTLVINTDNGGYGTIENSVKCT